jgi:hypothetical protein
VVFDVSVPMAYGFERYLRVFRGAFHLTEIPEILLENQMEHVNFRNAVSKIPDNLSRLSTNWKFRKFRNFYLPLKHFPTNVAAFQKFFEQKPPPKPKWRVLDHFSASSLDLFRRMLKEEI